MCGQQSPIALIGWIVPQKFQFQPTCLYLVAEVQKKTGKDILKF